MPLSELLAPFRRYADSGEINSVVEDPAGRIEAIAAALRGRAAGPHDGLTVEFDDWWSNVRAVEHRAAAPAERGGPHAGAARGADRRGAASHGIREAKEASAMTDRRSCWRSWCARTDRGEVECVEARAGHRVLQCGYATRCATASRSC